MVSHRDRSIGRLHAKLHDPPCESREWDLFSLQRIRSSQLCERQPRQNARVFGRTPGKLDSSCAQLTPRSETAAGAWVSGNRSAAVEGRPRAALGSGFVVLDDDLDPVLDRRDAWR